MTERTVTVQTEQEETITLCDHCGLSDDAGELVTYNVSQADSNGVENVRDYDSLDLHRSCLDEFGVDVPDAQTYSDAVLKANTELAGPIVALSRFSLLMLFACMFALGYGAWVGDMFFMGVGVLGVFGVLLLGHVSASETIEELQ